MVEALIAYCRAGFESEAAAELAGRARDRGVAGFCQARPGAGLAVFQAHEPSGARRLLAAAPLTGLVFARQLVLAGTRLSGLPAGDRVAPLAAALEAMGAPLAELFVEHPDTEAGKPLSALGRKLHRPLAAALERRGLLGAAGATHRGHVLLLDGATAWVGVSALADSAPWPMGIPRLRLPRAAPSRSARKLAEGLLVFLSPEQRAQRLCEGMRAVDLGAAPGGWSWVLARHGLFVTAVDHGRLAGGLEDDGSVTHVSADGFHYRPADAVDWMVCDMVEQPARIAKLVTEWVCAGRCRWTIFNLKLPMKKRLAEVERCRTILQTENVRVLRIKHLYHDREEITGFIDADGGA